MVPDTEAREYTEADMGPILERPAEGPPVRVIDVVGPILEGSIVAVRDPGNVDAEWFKEMGDELIRAAGHKRFVIYLVPEGGTSIAVFSADELAAVAAKHAGRIPVGAGPNSAPAPGHAGDPAPGPTGA